GPQANSAAAATPAILPSHSRLEIILSRSSVSSLEAEHTTDHRYIPSNIATDSLRLHAFSPEDCGARQKDGGREVRPAAAGTAGDGRDASPNVGRSGSVACVQAVMSLAAEVHVLAAATRAPAARHASGVLVHVHVHACVVVLRRLHDLGQASGMDREAWIG